MFRSRVPLAGRRMAYFALFECFVKLGFGEGRVGPEGHFLAQPLLALNLGQQQFLPALCAVYVARPQLGGEALALAVEQQERMITNRLEVSVVGTLLLLAMDSDL